MSKKTKFRNISCAVIVAKYLLVAEQSVNTLQDIFVADQFATTEILAVRKYGEIEQKPSHFGRHRK